MNVIRLEEKLIGNLTWMLQEGLSGDIDALGPVDKKILLDKVTMLTNKYSHFIVGALRAGKYGDSAINMFTQYLDQISNNMIRILEEARQRGEQLNG